VARLIGFDLVSVEPGKSVIEFQATEAHQNPMGTLHGGILCDIADAAMGIAMLPISTNVNHSPHSN
jgi:acyl-coenzyme A thioesterase PaaI-like protein